MNNENVPKEVQDTPVVSNNEEDKTLPNLNEIESEFQVSSMPNGPEITSPNTEFLSEVDSVVESATTPPEDSTEVTEDVSASSDITEELVQEDSILPEVDKELDITEKDVADTGNKDGQIAEPETSPEQEALANNAQTEQEVESAKVVIQNEVVEREKKNGFGKKIVATLAGLGLVAGGAVVAKNVVSDSGPANSEPVAEAPVTPGGDQQTSITPETLKQLQQIKVSEAEAKTGIAISEVKQKVDDPENTIGMKVIRQEGIEKESWVDIFALEYKTLLSDDYASIQQLLELKQVTPERVVELYKWYMANYLETSKLYNQEYIGSINVNELYYALSGPVVTARVAELLATNKISLPSSYEDKIDERVSSLIREYNGGDLGEYSETVNKVVMLMPNDNGPGFDTEKTYSNIEDFITVDMPFTSKGTIGPWDATYLSGNSEIISSETRDFLGKHY
jgi:hypothetical protein